jgi:SET domain-containing protein
MKYPRVVEGLLVKQTKSKGYGLFAQRDYKKGSVLLMVHGVRIDADDKRLTHRAVQVSKYSFVEPARFSGIWYLNHSCEPNAYINMKTLFARRDIKKGEEITADYSLFITFPGWDMECECKTVSCRKIILPYEKLPVKPKQFVSSYLLSKRG